MYCITPNIPAPYILLNVLLYVFNLLLAERFTTSYNASNLAIKEKYTLS